MSTGTAHDAGIDRWVARFSDVRARTLNLIQPLSATDLERQFDPILSPLVWDLAHIAAYEDLWLVHRHAGVELLYGELAATYDAFETPRAVRGEIALLDTAGALAYMADVRERTLAALETHGIDDVIHGMVLRHEQQHTETMLQTLSLARLPEYDVPGRVSAAPGAGTHTGLEFVPVAGGEITIGAAPDAFSFDNERPEHVVSVAPFRIARTPVTNATWLNFTEGGGYTRREWWSQEAWAWKQEYDISHPLHWERRPDGSWLEHTLHGSRDLDHDRPAAHVSWFEAAAIAKAHGARLPTEAEWETAATWTQTGQPQGSANLAPSIFGTSPVGAFPAGAADCGALDLLGNLWEWTSTEFDGYPGFSAHPYREYSEVFFASGMRALRGGSWATQSEVATRTFRNWDLPERRQIFCGVRLAIDEEQS